MIRAAADPLVVTGPDNKNVAKVIIDGPATNAEGRRRRRALDADLVYRPRPPLRLLCPRERQDYCARIIGTPSARERLARRR